MRLTERKVCYPECDKQGNLTKVDYIEIKNKGLAEEKLCQLEDIEEKLGIDLVTFFKAFENGVYAFDKGKKIVKGYIAIAYDNGDFEDYLRFVLPDRLNCDELHFKDYGRTWALTKEELL